MIIQPIVEGYGEVEAIPVLVRRLIDQSGAYRIGVTKPIRRTRYQLVRKDDLQRSVELALKQPGCVAVIINLDADQDCPVHLATQIREWASATAAGRAACEVVIANREYEAWFLAAIDSLRGLRGIRCDAVLERHCEDICGAKEALEKLLEEGLGYHETTDQPALTALFDMKQAFERSRSFRRMVKAFENISGALGEPCSCGLSGQITPGEGWGR